MVWLRRQQRGQPLAADQVHDGEAVGRLPAAGEVSDVESPRTWLGVLDPLRPRLGHRGTGTSGAAGRPTSSATRTRRTVEGATHTPFDVGAPMGQLAVAAVDRSPLLGQGQDRPRFHRCASWRSSRPPQLVCRGRRVPRVGFRLRGHRNPAPPCTTK